MLKIIIIVLFFLVVASLSSALVFLVRDIGVPESRRSLFCLGIRITLAISLMVFIGYGIHTGQLNNTAPWDRTIDKIQ
jgi:hypothetical protein